MYSNFRPSSFFFFHFDKASPSQAISCPPANLLLYFTIFSGNPNTLHLHTHSVYIAMRSPCTLHTLPPSSRCRAVFLFCHGKNPSGSAHKVCFTKKCDICSTRLRFNKSCRTFLDFINVTNMVAVFNIGYIARTVFQTHFVFLFFFSHRGCKVFKQTSN